MTLQSLKQTVKRSRWPTSKIKSALGFDLLGFALSELMITAAVIGIVLGIAIPETGRAYNRDQLNEAALLLRGWLSEIARRPDTLGQACTVTISTGTIATGGQIASVSPSTCSNTPILRLPGISNRSYSVGTTQTSWSFTPRYAISSASNIEIKLSLSSSTLPALRCVRVGAISGLLRLGRNDTTSNVSSSCTTWSSI
jgi:type II secretory pathway pseudopilin PulG